MIDGEGLAAGGRMPVFRLYSSCFHQLQDSRDQKKKRVEGGCERVN